MYFCAAGLEIDQTKGGPDALHPVPHSRGLRGNLWSDGPLLRYCSMDAEHLLNLPIRGIDGSVQDNPCALGGYLSLGFHAANADAQNLSRKGL